MGGNQNMSLSKSRLIFATIIIAYSFYKNKVVAQVTSESKYPDIEQICDFLTRVQHKFHNKLINPEVLSSMRHKSDNTIKSESATYNHMLSIN